MQDATARDGNIAILEEYEAARKKNTIQAYEVFIARHDGHPKAKDARRQITALKQH